MKIKITGAGGYLGAKLTRELKRKGHITESIPHEILYDKQNELKQKLKGADVIINLAGVKVFTRWTEENKKKIYDSRVVTTSNLVKAIDELDDESRPKKFISASATGIYQAGKKHDENSSDFDNGFVGDVVKDWEKASKGLPENVTRIVFRIAPVYGKDSETIQKLWLPFKLGIGGKIGSGNQPFPFVHVDDVINAFIWAVEKYNQNSVFNLVAPENISNKKFTNTLAAKLHRPAVFPVPEIGLKLFFGEAAGMLTESPEIEPRGLQNAGYQFLYPTIDDTLSEIIEQKNPA